MDENLGRKIKSLRLIKKMTLKQVSEKTGLSISFISQVERSKSSVTLASLRRIADSLDVTPSYFFTNDNSNSNSSVRRGVEEERNSSILPFTYKSLSGNFQNQIFEPILAVLLPGERDNLPYTHTGQEFVYVLSGVLTVVLEKERHLLYAGDSFHIDSTTRHVWFNETEEPIKLLIVSSVNNEKD